jgi:hypothetical protein
LGFGGAGELGGARRTAGFKSVDEAEFSCTRIVSSEVQTLIPASGEGRGLITRLSNQRATLAGRIDNSRVRGGIAQVISAGLR